MPVVLNRWAFRGHLLNRTEMRVRTMTGVGSSVPPLRGADFLTMGVTGQQWVRKLSDSRRIGLELLLTDAIYRGQIPAMLDELGGIFADRSQGALVQYAPDGTIRTAQAECLDWMPADSKANAGMMYVGIADFLLADPWFYSPSVVTTGAVPTTGTVVNVTTAATAYPHGPQGVLTLDLLGPIAAPIITNSANGVSVTINVTVASTKHLIVDCVNFTAVNDGVNAISSVLHSGALPFMILQPGLNPLTVAGTAMTGATSLTVTYAPPYA